MKKIFLLLISMVTLLSSCDNGKEAGDVLATNITLSETELHLKIGQSATILALIEPENVTTNRVIWTIEDATVAGCATVDKDGKVTAVKDGYATAVATTIDGSGVEARCPLTLGNPNPEGVYSLGDAYPNEENPIGVVFYTENEGKNGKIVALNYCEDELIWGNDDITTNATEEYDGLLNTKIVQGVSSDFSEYPSFKWVHEHMNNSSATYETGAVNVWYIPSQRELRQLFAAMCGLRWRNGSNGNLEGDVISDWGTDMAMPYYTDFEEEVAEFNTYLEELGGAAISHDWHWSSSEVVNYFTWYVDLYCGYTYHYHKGSPAIVRAVMRF